MASGVLHVAAGVACLLMGLHSGLGGDLVLVLVGVAHVALARLSGRSSLRVAFWLLSMYFELVVLGAQAAWQPTCALLSLVLCVYGGFFLGRRWSWLPPAGLLLLFVTGGLALSAGWRFDVLSPNEPANWLRVAAIYFIIVLAPLRINCARCPRSWQTWIRPRSWS